MKKSVFFQLKKDLSLEDLNEQLSGDLSIIRAASSHQDLILLDNYDGDIWQAGWLLLRNDQKELQLFDKDGQSVARASCRDNLKFWWELPSGELAERLKQLISVRALVEKDAFGVSHESFVLLNEDEKTVARAETYSIKNQRDQLSRFVRIVPLRGYAQECELVLRLLSGFSEPSEALTFRDLLMNFGCNIEIPESKPAFDLDATDSAEAAVTRMAAKMIQLARCQEEGIIDDIDTEFVHQYRVNIRKTRSLISLFRKTLSPQRYQLLKGELKMIAGQTNVLRDLDVFILDHDHYQQLLPEHLWPGFRQLFQRIRRQRAQAYRKVAASLKSEEYLERISALLRTLQQPPELISKQAQSAIRDLVSQKILAQYRVIEADGCAIDSSTPDDVVHELRIECKKLRYLLELFAELYPKKQLKELVNHLKGLQDNLGRFNDFSVQQEFLLHYNCGKTVSTEQLAAIHGLTAVLYNKQVHERGQVVDNIAAFLEPSVKDLLHRLFQSSARKESEE